MSLLQALLLLLAAGSGAAVVANRDPSRQLFALVANGAVLAALFFALEAPDVALSEIAVGAVVTPSLFLVTLAAVSMEKARRR